MLIRPVVELERGETALAQMLLIAQDRAVAETDREANQPSPTCLAWKMSAIQPREELAELPRCRLDPVRDPRLWSYPQETAEITLD
jgi:hypothetical protein